MLDVNKIRKDFPILGRKVNGKPLVYLDSAATSQKPKAVIEALKRFYEENNANIHRGIHTLSEESTAAYEGVREKIKNFIDAPETRSVIFTRNTTESMNLLAQSWGRQHVLPGDEIVLSAMEHHSNLIPWQMLAADRQAKLKFIELTADGQIDMRSANEVIGQQTKIVSISHMSNALGTINPVQEIGQIARKNGALFIVDGAQSVPHLPTSFQKLGCDFLAFSLHKMLGPTGVGVLVGKSEILESMPPFLGGGDMIASVWRDRATYAELPFKFEAGTPNIADVIASGAAISYLEAIGMEAVRAHEVEISRYALEKLAAVEGLTVYGPLDAQKRGSVFSFNFADMHPHDIGQILNESGIAIRTGHHCCQPLMRDLNVSGTARASFYIYNTKEEVDILVDALKEANKVMGNVAFR